MACLRIFKADLLRWARNPNPWGRGWFWTRILQRVNIESSTNIAEILPIINWSLPFISLVWRLTGPGVVRYELTHLHSENTALRGRKHYMGLTQVCFGIWMSEHLQHGDIACGITALQNLPDPFSVNLYIGMTPLSDLPYDLIHSGLEMWQRLPRH